MERPIDETAEVSLSHRMGAALPTGGWGGSAGPGSGRVEAASDQMRGDGFAFPVLQDRMLALVATYQ